MRSSAVKRVLTLAIATLVICGSAEVVPASAPPSTQSTTTDATFRRGNDAYFKGHYAEAIAAYEQLAGLGILSDDLFYNLGNAYLKSGAIGPAVYNYERALELDPGQEDVDYNLKAARELGKKKGDDRLVGAESVPLWIRLVQPYTIGNVSWSFLALYMGVFVLLMVLHFVSPGFLRVSLWAAFSFMTFAAVVSGALLGGRLYLATSVEQAVVLPDSVQVKEGPDPNYQPLFNVHAGLRVRVTEKEQDWVRIRLSNGLEGWVREREIGRL